jgi:hypothetical protein
VRRQPDHPDPDPRHRAPRVLRLPHAPHEGPRICANRTLVRQRDAEQAILETIEHDLLRADVLDAAIGRVLHQLDPEATARETSRLETDSCGSTASFAGSPA